MNLRTRILSACAMLGIALAASTASAQVTLVSQNRIVSANGCQPPTGGNQSAPGFGPFTGRVTIICPTDPFGFGSAQQTSSLAPGAFSLSHQGNAGGVAGSDSRFQVVFDVTTPTVYTFTGTSDDNIPIIRFTGPDVNIEFRNSTRTESGLLQPGRYTVFSSLFGTQGRIVSATLEMTFSTLPFTIPWSTLDCGGGNLSGGAFDLLGTIGQADAAIPILTSTDGYRLTLGYWARDPGTPPCVADYDDGSGAGQPDGGVTIDDLLYYIDLFRQGSASADVDDGSFTNTPDGGVTIDDLLYFLFRFGEGC